MKSKSHNVFTNHYFGCFSWWALSFGQLCKGMWVLILLVIVIYFCLTYMVKNRVGWCSGLIITLWFQFQWLKKCLFSLFFLCFSPFIKSPELMGSTMRNRPPRSQFMKTYTAGGLALHIMQTFWKLNLACSAVRVLKQSIPEAKLNLIYVRNSTLLLHWYSPESYLYPFGGTKPKV